MRKMVVRVDKNCNVRHEMSGFSDNTCFAVADRVKAGASVYVKEQNVQVINTGPDCSETQEQGQFNPN